MSLTKEIVLQRLRRKARRWGGDIEEVELRDFKCLQDEKRAASAPFTDWDIGTDYEAKVVYVTTCCEPSEVELFATGLIHEMGHAFASPDPPDESDEFKFIGWEVALGRRIGLTDQQFCRQVYGLGDVSSFPDKVINVLFPDRKYKEHASLDLSELTDPIEQEAVLRFLVKKASENGLIRYGHPISIR